VDSKIKRQFTGEKNFAFEKNAINARQLREGRPVAEWWEGNKSVSTVVQLGCQVLGDSSHFCFF